MSLPTFRQGGPGAYPGVGQGLPNRFPQRQASGSSNPLQSPPPFSRPNTGAFPFSAASQALPPAATNAPGLTPEPNLDPSDFPALGAGAPGSTNAANSASNLLSSYASQAGTGAAGTPLSATSNPLLNGSTASGLPAAAQQGNATARDFSADDFPVLGGFGAATAGDMAGLSNGSNGQLSNGISLLSGGGAAGTRAVSGAGQEQASAVAALQHQQQQSQHRANLLGSMNGAQSRTPSSATDAGKAFALKQGNAASSPASQQPWASTPPPQHAQPPMNGAASSPLPPAANQPSSSLDQQQQGLRSPSASAQGPPPGVSLLPPSSQPQRAVGSTASGAPTGLPPHPSGHQGIAGSALPPPTSLAPQTPAEQVLFSPADRYGLLGLLHIIKTTDPDLSMLALGSDLTTLGLDLGATDNLYSTFITPWSDSKAASALNIEPEFHLPSCYNVQPPPAQSKIGNFSDETLFFIFYSQPRDAMQEMAAHELYKHNWRYHKELRLWLTKEAGTEPTQKTSSYERGSYIIFDPTVWERVRKEFVLEFSALESRRA